MFLYESMAVNHSESESVTSLHREGRAILDAVTMDINSIPGLTAWVADSNYADAGMPIPRFREASAKCNWFLFLAPTMTTVMDFVRTMSDAGSRSLTSSREATEIVCDKLKLAVHWEIHNVPTPLTAEATSVDWHRNPMICKPRFGAGSENVFLFSADQWEEMTGKCVTDFSGIIQEFVPGRAASIAILCGSNQHIPLRPTFQSLSQDGRFHYLGGLVPIPPGLEDRAMRLGLQAVKCVPGLAGYVGVDLVLGAAADGSDDYAIEINPRLTTSYVGMRELADFNLVQAMIDVVKGKPVEYVRWKPGRVRFEPDGHVEYDPTSGAFFE